MEICVDSAPISMYWHDIRIPDRYYFTSRSETTCESDDVTTVCRYSFDQTEFDKVVRRPRTSTLMVTNHDGEWTSTTHVERILVNTTESDNATLLVISGPVQRNVGNVCGAYKTQSYCKEPKFEYLHVDMFAYGKFVDESLISQRLAELVRVLPNAFLLQELSYATDNRDNLYKFVFKIPYHVGLFSRIMSLQNSNRVFLVDAKMEFVIKTIYLQSRFTPTEIVHPPKPLSREAVAVIVVSVLLALGIIVCFVSLLWRYRKKGYQSLAEDME